MKKIITALLMLTLLLQGKAQRLSINYTQHFKPESSDFLKNKKIVPQSVWDVTIGYSQQLKNQPVIVRAAVSGGRKKPPPPRWIMIKSEILKYAKDNNFETDSAAFTKSTIMAIGASAGIGYILPHKPGSIFTLTLNMDAGVSINSSQTLNFYFQKKLTSNAEVQKAQLIISPNIQGRFAISNNAGINVRVGYSNLGGMNAGAGLSFNLAGKTAVPKCKHWICCGNCGGKGKD